MAGETCNMPHLMPLMRQYFDMFHFAFLFVAILAALLGGVIGSLRGKPQGTAAGAITGGILGGALSIVIGPAGNYLILHSHCSSWGTGLIFFFIALLGGILGGLMGGSIIDFFREKLTRFPNHPAGFPRDPAGGFRLDSINKPDVREATRKLQETRYTVINVKEKAVGGSQQEIDIGAILSGLRSILLPLLPLAIFFLVLFFLCTYPAARLSNSIGDLMESVFRYQFTHNCSGKQDKAFAYYLSIYDDKDPSDTFMKRFEKHIPPVKKISQSRMKKDLGTAVIDEETGKEGIIFRIRTIRWINKETVEVEGGYYEGSLSASENTYQVIRKGRSWVVTKDTCNSISYKSHHRQMLELSKIPVIGFNERNDE